MTVPVTDPDTRLWRTDLKLGRNIYALLSNNVQSPSELDPLVGVMESSELAENVVDMHNNVLRKYGRHYLKVLATND
jgi:hypothetical protein